MEAPASTTDVPPTSNFALQVAARIRSAREELNLTQEDLTGMMGFNDRQTLSAMETGERAVAPGELTKLARFLKKGVEYFTDPYVVTERQAFSYRAKSNSSDVTEFENLAHRLISADRRFRQLLEEPGVPFCNQLNAIGKQSPLSAAAMAGEATGRSLKLGCPPADSLREAIESQLKINLFYVDAPATISGAACHLPDGNYILINRREPSYRRNFNAGHELFHLLTWNVMPPDRVDLITAADDRPKSEKMADNFSAGLLMPADQICTRFRQKPGSVDIHDWILALGKEFRVSGEALYWRLTNLGQPVKSVDVAKLPRFDAAGRDGMPSLFNAEFVRRLHLVLMRGFVSVRKAASVLGVDPDDLYKIVEDYGHEASF